MAAARHDPNVLADLQGGERCLVWARHKTDGALYRLADGEARTLRSWTKEHLECLMPDCADRRLTTVARHPRRRDGFSHYAGAGGHSAESEAHQQGKAALVAWVTQSLGGQGVHAAAKRSTSDHSRVADVMVTWPDGRKVALEVQYAPLSVHDWRARHESHREQGIPAVWLLGHTGTHLRPARRYDWESEEDAAGLVALSDLMRAMADAGAPVLWINPVLGQGPTIGTAVVTVPVDEDGHRSYEDGHDDEAFDVPPRSFDVRAALATDLLSSCTLDPTGLSTLALDRLRTAELELAAINAARRATNDAREAAEAEARAGAARWTTTCSGHSSGEPADAPPGRPLPSGSGCSSTTAVSCRTCCEWSWAARRPCTHRPSSGASRSTDTCCTAKSGPPSPSAMPTARSARTA